MRSLVKRSLLFAALFVATGFLLKLPLSYGWGNAWWTQKRAIMLAQPQRPNLFFMGSSRIHWHLAPTLFDSAMTARGVRTRSFNLGLPGVFPPEAYHLLEGAVESGEIPSGSTVLMELSEPAAVEEHLIRTARASYFQTPSTWWMMARYFRETRSPGNRWRYLRGSTWALLRNTFHVGQFKSAIGHADAVYTEGSGINVRGFTTLDREVLVGATEELRKNLRKRKEELLADTMLLELRRDSTLMVRATAPSAPSASWREAIEDVTAVCREHNVQLLWFMPPRMISKREWAMINALDPASVIDMSDPNEFPMAFQMRFRFDRGHFNEAGARLHTVMVAQSLADRMK